MTPEAIAAQLDLWRGLEGGTATLINLSENHTFRIDTPDGQRHIIRVHRPDYQSKLAISSELTWLNALRADTDLVTITPLAGTNGEFIQILNGDDGAARFAVRFAFEKGVEPRQQDMLSLFPELGRIAAICHRHVESWRVPDDFTRPSWNAGNILDADGLWGDWRVVPGVSGEVGQVLDRLDRRLRADLAAYGTEEDRFGLIHADMRLANLLVHDGQTRLIDFDDCGFGWFAYDFAAAISFFEDHEDVPQLKALWLEAYRKVRNFSAVDEAVMETMVLLRRMALLAWIGSHGETSLAKSLAEDFAANSAVLAETYLSRE